MIIKLIFYTIYNGLNLFASHTSSKDGPVGDIIKETILIMIMLNIC